MMVVGAGMIIASKGVAISWVGRAAGLYRRRPFGHMGLRIRLQWTSGVRLFLLSAASVDVVVLLPEIRCVRPLRAQLPRVLGARAYEVIPAWLRRAYART